MCFLLGFDCLMEIISLTGENGVDFVSCGCVSGDKIGELARAEGHVRLL